MNEIMKPLDWYKTNFDLFEKTLNGESSLPIHNLRKQAIEELSLIGFPASSNEEWRFTNIGPILKKQFKPVLDSNEASITMEQIQQFVIESEPNLLVFINGHFSTSLSTIKALPNGAIVGSLLENLKSVPEKVMKYLGQISPIKENSFSALNASFMNEGFFVYLPDGASIEKPVQVLFMSTDRTEQFITNPRNLVVAGKNSHISIIETYAGLAGNAYFTNAVTEMMLFPDANVDCTKLILESDSAYHVGTTQIYQHTRSKFTSNCISLSGAIVRNNLLSKLDDEWIECTFNGLSLGTDENIIDNHTTIDHAKPNCASHELYKAILDQKSRGVFNGKIFVREDAQKTDAKQTNKTLLLSDEATIDTKPQLEIFADDVKCTHGAAVGQLDPQQIFYLRSRGFSEDHARDVLTTAFADDLINRIQHTELREKLHTLIFEQLHQGRTGSIA